MDLAKMMHEILSNLCPVGIDPDNEDIRTYRISTNDIKDYEITARTTNTPFNGESWSYEILSWEYVDPYPCINPGNCPCC